MSDNFEKYKGTINSLYRRTKDDLWTPQLATVLLLLGGILIVTIFLNVALYSFGNMFITFLVYLVEAAVPLIVLYIHQRKIFEIMREKVLEMDAANPGIYQAYEEWRSRYDNRTS
jgi:hypothetical protein